MNNLLLATHNIAKLEELKFGCSSLIKKGVKVLSLSDIKIKEEPEETGVNFEENSELKAKFYANLSGLPTIGDDGGLMIDILGGEPGVKSRRWMGYDAPDNKLINYTLHKLKNIPTYKRTAYLATCLCYYNPQTKTIFFEEEKIKGHIAEKPSGRKTDGYPFRALFIVDEYKKYYDELTDSEHLEINHRMIALKRLITKMGKDLLK